MPAYTHHDTIIYDPEADETIYFKEDEDGLNMLLVKSDSDHYGKINFSLPLDVAEAFAEAMKKQCQFIRERVTYKGW